MQNFSLFKKGLTTFLATGISLVALNAQAESWPIKEAGAKAAGFSEEGIQRLDAAMNKVVADQDVAGMVWILAKDGEVATFETAGLSRVDDQAPMEMDSLFRIYSMTKPVTGVALMMLHEKGLWNFDDPVSKYVPEFANLRVMTSYDEDGKMEISEIHGYLLGTRIEGVGKFIFENWNG